MTSPKTLKSYGVKVSSKPEFAKEGEDGVTLVPAMREEEAIGRVIKVEPCEFDDRMMWTIECFNPEEAKPVKLTSDVEAGTVANIKVDLPIKVTCDLVVERVQLQ